MLGGMIGIDLYGYHFKSGFGVQKHDLKQKKNHGNIFHPATGGVPTPPFRDILVHPLRKTNFWGFPNIGIWYIIWIEISYWVWKMLFYGLEMWLDKSKINFSITKWVGENISFMYLLSVWSSFYFNFYLKPLVDSLHYTPEL